MATPIFICGAECGIAAVGAASVGAGGIGSSNHWTQFGAGWTLQVGGGKTAGAWSANSYKLVVVGGTGARMVHTFPTAIASPAVMVARFRIMFDSLPTGAIHDFFSETGGLCGLRYNPTGTQIEAWAGSTPVLAGAFIPTAGTWYLIDVRFTRGTTASTEWSVDGNAQTTASAGGQSAATIASFFFSHNTSGVGGGGATTTTYYVDDICVSGTTGDFPLGDGRVDALYPDADGAHSMTAGDLKADTISMTNSTTNSWTKLQTSLSTTISTFVSQTVSRTTSFGEWQFDASPSDVDTVNGVEVASAHHGSTTGAHQQTMILRDGTVSQVCFATSDFSDITISFNTTVHPTAPSTGTAWTKTLLDGVRLRWGYSGDVVGNPILDGACLEVDYNVAGTTAIADSDFTPAFSDAFAEAVTVTVADSDFTPAFNDGLAESITSTGLKDTLESFVFSDAFQETTAFGTLLDAFTFTDAFTETVAQFVSIADSDFSLTFSDSFAESIAATLADTLESFGFLELGNTIAAVLADTLESFGWTEFTEAISAVLSDTLDAYGLSELGNSIAANLADAIELVALGELQENLAALLADTIENLTWIELQEALSAVLSDTLEPFTFNDGFTEGLDTGGGGPVPIADSDFSLAFSDGFSESVAATVADTLESFGWLELGNTIAATVADTIENLNATELAEQVAAILADVLEPFTFNDGFTESLVQFVSIADSDFSLAFTELGNSIAATVSDTIDPLNAIELAEAIAAILADTLDPFTWNDGFTEDVQQGLLQIADSDFSPAFSEFAESIAATLADTLETSTTDEQATIAATVGGGLDTGTGNDVDGGIALLSSDTGTGTDVEGTIAAVLADSETGILAEFNAITATLVDSLDLFSFVEFDPRIDIPLPPGQNGTATLVFTDLYSATVTCGAIWSATATSTKPYSATAVCTTHTATASETDLGEATQVIV